MEDILFAIVVIGIFTMAILVAALRNNQRDLLGALDRYKKENSELMKNIKGWYPFIQGHFEGRSDEFDLQIEKTADLIKKKR